MRKSLGVRFEGRRSTATPGLLADVGGRRPRSRVWHVWPLAKGCVLTLCPLAGTSQFQLAAPLLSKRRVAPETEPSGSLRVRREPNRQRRRPRRASVAWTSLVRPRCGWSTAIVSVAYSGRRCGHVHPPVGGQGLNTGVPGRLQPRVEAGTCLTGASDVLLDSYEIERFQSQRAYSGSASGCMRTRKPEAGRGDAAADIHYRDSSLAQDTRHAPGSLRAGDRAPDAVCVDRDGAPTRLFDKFADTIHAARVRRGGHRNERRGAFCPRSRRPTGGWRRRRRRRARLRPRELRHAIGRDRAREARRPRWALRRHARRRRLPSARWISVTWTRKRS